MTRVAILALVVTTGCLNLAEERAQREDTVGHLERDGLAVHIDGGHAAVRSLAPNAVTLWAQAPEIDMMVSLGTGPSSIRIENVLADATLVARDGGVVTAFEAVSATESIWTVEATGDARFGLRVADSGDTTPWRFLMFADVQDAIDQVGDIYTLMNSITDARFVVMAGDLTERGTVAQLEEFREQLRTLSVPLYVTLGNHELGFSKNPYYDYFGRGTHMFRYRGVQFTFVDTASATVATKARAELAPWLVEGRDYAHVAIMHIPPVDPIGARAGSFSSKTEAYGFLNELAVNGVDLTLYGHVHSFYAFSNAGIPAFIAGGGGAIPERMDGIGRHFLSIDVEPLLQRFEVGLVRVD